MKRDLAKKAIEANIHALAAILDTATLRVAESLLAISEGEQNQAIGGLIDLEEQLQNALALHRAALALHRAARMS